VLAEGIEVKAATLDNGLLHVDLVRPRPEPRVKNIPIQGATLGAASGSSPRAITVEGDECAKARSKTGQ
jgi:hypothetical protein